MATRLTRAQVLTGTAIKPEFYSDFLDSFMQTPAGNQLAKVVNERSVGQALKNLILTRTGERFFNPNFGSEVLNSLFENNSSGFLSDLEFYIQTAILNNEPRVNVTDITVKSINDDHEVEINIYYTLINNPEPLNFRYILKRVR